MISLKVAEPTGDILVKLYVLSRPGKYRIKIGFAMFKFLLKLSNEVLLTFPSFLSKFSQNNLKNLKIFVGLFDPENNHFSL